MGLYQSYQQVFVTNSPALLAEGKTVDSLATGQIGFLDAKTYKALVAPTYAKNKAIYAVWGTPDVNVGEFGGVPNENEYSKIIKGKLVKKLRAKKAQRGVTPVYTIGWSGDVSDTDTLFARTGESKDLFIKLSGTVIDRLYSKNGLIKGFKTTPACTDDCSDLCSDVSCPDLAQQLVDQINSDKDFRKFIRAKALISCVGVTPPATTPCYKFAITVCDTGDDRSLGILQAQYPDLDIDVISRNGALTTYGVVRDANTLPAAFSNVPVIVPDCPSCALGTLIPEAMVFEVRTPNGVLPAAVQAAFSDEGAVVLLNNGPQFATYTVTFPVGTDESDVVAEADAANYVATFVGTKRNICQLPAVNVTWAADGTLLKQAKAYRLTIADSICGENRLADLQAAFPELVVSIVDATGECVHTYETTVNSNCYADGCAIEEIKFVTPPMFEGAQWKEVVPAPGEGECKCGIQIETAFVNRTTNDCTFDSFPYENDIVHVQVSNYNPDFNADPCEGEWAFKQIRQVQYPQGHGAYIQRLEKESKQYDQRFRSFEPVVREVQGYSLQADPTKFYDQYVLEFDTKWKSSGGWSEDYTQSFHLNFFVPEGTGAAIERALNSYITSAGIEEDGAAI